MQEPLSVTERGGVSQLVDNTLPNVAQWAVIVTLRWAPPSTLLALAEQSLGARRRLEMNIRQKIEKDARPALIFDSSNHGRSFLPRWLDEIVTGAVTSIEQIAARGTCRVRQVNLARVPRAQARAGCRRRTIALGDRRCAAAPPARSHQYVMLGLSI